jgi:hypothetical protein
MIVAGYLLAALALLGVSALTAWSYAHAGQRHPLMHDGPVIIMYTLGAWLFLPLGWVWLVAYLVAVVICNLSFVTRVCGHCLYHGRADAPSLYCALATRFVAKGDPQRFASRFRRYTKVLAVNWILPIIGGVVALWRTSEWAYGLALLPAFGLIAFYLVPLATRPSCQQCLNKDACPYARHVNSSHHGQCSHEDRDHLR